MSKSVGCPYAEHGLCQVATKLANMPVPLNEQACAVCVKQPVKFGPNRVTGAIALFARGDGDLYLTHLATDSVNLAGHVLQRYVHKWMRRLRVSTPPGIGCGCEGLVAQMNEWGLDGSLERVDEIAAQLFTNLKSTYLAGLAVPFLTIPLIRHRVRKCLLTARSLSP